MVAAALEQWGTAGDPDSFRAEGKTHPAARVAALVHTRNQIYMPMAGPDPKKLLPTAASHAQSSAPFVLSKMELYNSTS